MRVEPRLIFVLSFLAAQLPLAVGAEPAEPPEQAAITPPVLLRHGEARLPDGMTSEVPLSVELVIEIGVDGTVQSARAKEGAPPELAEAAQDSVLEFLFEPARRGSEPIAVAIDYTFWFPARPAPVEPTSDAPERVPVESPVPSPPPEAPASEPAAPEPADEPLEFEATAEVEAPPREPTRRTLPAEQLRKSPGSRGDAIRAIEVLPGVARAPQGSNPILRGAAGHESKTLLDGVEIPQLYHFGGVTSVVHPSLLGEVNLYASNYSARYGRATGGIIEAKLRDPRDDGLHGVVDINLIDSSALVEGPLTEGLSGAAAVRRSNIDFVFETFVPEDTFSVVAAPLYWDYQALAQYRPDRDSRLRLVGSGARDQLKFVFSEPSFEDPSLRGEVSGSTEYHTLTVGYDRSGRTLRQSYQVSIGYDALRQNVGGFEAYFDGLRTAARAEWQIDATDSLELISGIDYAGTVLTGAYRGPHAPAMEGSLDQPESALRLLVVDEITIAQLSPAAYVEARWFPTSRWLVVPGMRVDYFHDLDALTLNPRLGQRYSLDDDWTLKAGLGAFSQRPEYYESLDEVGNPALDPYHALHASLGVERRFGDVLSVDTEGFYKHLYDRVVATEGGAPPQFINDGEGRIYGVEAQARFTPNADWFGQLSYTLSRSERTDRDEPTRLFDYDQTHVLNSALGVQLGAGWEAGARFRFISGNPETPVIGAVYDARSGVYQPRYGAHNSARDPAFHQLDLRVDKRFAVGSGSISAYLEVLNVYNQENPEGHSYSYDYSERTRVSSQPFFPNLGIRGEL